MAKRWFVIREGKELGPLSSAALKDLAEVGRLRPEDLVRREDMKSPAKAGAVKGLFGNGEAPQVLPSPAAAQEQGAVGAGRIDNSVPLDDLRRRLTSFADGIPHHGIKSLGDAITVLAADCLRVYRVRWTTLFERRERVERERPHERTRAVPPCRFDAQDLDLWQQALPTAANFEKHAVEVPLENSQQVGDCGQCGAAGAVMCDACRGQRQAACPACSGGGVQACSRCSGTGTTVETYTERRQRHCRSGIGPGGIPTACYAGYTDRGIVCSNCNGTGIEWYSHAGMRQASCPACGAAGRVRCGSCNGGGIIVCPRCQGHGRVVCQRCTGHGRLVRYLAVIQSHEPKSSAVTISAEECPRECVAALDECHFEEVLQQTNLRGPLDIELDDETRHLFTDARRMQAALRAGADVASRPTGDYLLVSRAIVYRLDYSLEGKSFIAWFCGRDGSVHAPVSPVTNAAVGLVEASLAAWSDGQKSQAADALRRALGMAKVSPDCARALEPLKPRFPEELLRRASLFSLRHWFQNLSPVRKAFVAAPLGCLGLYVVGLCFFCVTGTVLGPIMTKKSPQEATGAAGGQHRLTTDQERLIAEVEAHAPPAPNFSEDELKFDFTKDDYGTIPAGAKKHTRKEIIRAGKEDLIGKPETNEGYTDRSGKFVCHGPFTTWIDDSETRKHREGNIFHGKLHGIVVYYHPDGKKKSEAQWVKGQLHGAARSWHENGRLEGECGYVDGASHGPRRLWHSNGQLGVEETWVRGKQHGVSKTWFKDGRLASIGCFRDGKKNGKFWSQNEDGSLGETGEWENGRPRGRCRFWFTGRNERRYYIEVSDERWQSGTIAEFIARMYYYSLRDRPDIGLQFDPEMRIANYFSKDEDEFFARFGKPSQDALDIEKAPSGAPARLRDRYRVWSYACRDGVLSLRVQPTQSGTLFVTAHWRDNSH